MKYWILVAATLYFCIAFYPTLRELKVTTTGSFAVFQIVLTVLGWIKACEMLNRYMGWDK